MSKTEEIATKVGFRLDRLTQAITEAYNAGLQVEIEVVQFAPRSRPNITLRVMRPLYESDIPNTVYLGAEL